MRDASHPLLDSISTPSQRYGPLEVAMSLAPMRGRCSYRASPCRGAAPARFPVLLRSLLLTAGRVGVEQPVQMVRRQADAFVRHCDRLAGTALDSLEKRGPDRPL